MHVPGVAAPSGSAAASCVALGVSLLLIQPKFLAAAKSAGSASDLHELLQYALRLEHSTIPPYLTAAYSIHPNTNAEIFLALKEIAEEEMLHMAMVGNVLNAIGGSPNIAEPDFLPTYPDTLPMSIGNGLVVGLKKFTRSLVKNVFMEIEKPETPLNFPVGPLAADGQEFATIGQFYQAIIDKIVELGGPIFVGDPNLQVTVDQPGLWERLKPIAGVADAVAALGWIVQDGEGTTNGPFDGDGKPAHYYRFAEIYHGFALIEDNGSQLGFRYGGAPIPLDEASIYDVPDNPKASDYAPGTDARRGIEQFNQLYSDILRTLHLTFNGQPNQIAQALALMGRMRTLALRVVRVVDQVTGKRAGLTFEYVPPATG